MTSILKYAVLVISLSLTATLQAKSINDSSHAQKLSKAQIECLSINAYMEARNQGVKGMQAVTWVVLNRTKHPSYPSTPCAVIYAPFQFEWTRNGKTPKIKEKDAYTQAEGVVEGVLSGKLKDNTNSSTHFHSARIKPKWANRLSYTTTIGSHCFYKLKK
jgi:spore germination cell wall hydrolase CwlJ-like protein